MTSQMHSVSERTADHLAKVVGKGSKGATVDVKPVFQVNNMSA